MELGIPDIRVTYKSEKTIKNKNFQDDSGWFQKRSILDVVHVRSGTGGKMVIKAVARGRHLPK